MQQQLFSADSCGGQLASPRSRLRPAPRQLVLLIERHAQGCRACLPERCEKISAGRTCVATQLTSDEAVKLEAQLRAELRETLAERDAERNWRTRCVLCHGRKAESDVICAGCFGQLAPVWQHSFRLTSNQQQAEEWLSELLISRRHQVTEDRHAQAIP